MSLVLDLLNDAGQLLVEELPTLEQLAATVADAITQKKSLDQATAQAEVVAADISADVLEDQKFPTKEGT